MKHAPDRRKLLLAAAALPFWSSCSAWRTNTPTTEPALTRLRDLERDLDGRLGVFALNTGNGRRLGYRGDERFPLCSTFKLIAAAGVLKRSEETAGLLAQRIGYGKDDLVTYSPITERHVGAGLTVGELCAASLQYSDNTAGNLLIKLLGGPEAVTAYARTIGDREFRLDRWETELNSAIPGDPRDTTTPAAMGLNLQQWVLGDALNAASRAQLTEWLLGNTTGAARIKAGIPADWKIGDKTGSGLYGSANDVAVIWPPQRAPAIVSVYSTRNVKEAKPRNDIVASAAAVVADWLKQENAG